MTPQSTYRLISGDCLDRLREMPECSIDAVVTDPPYGLTNGLRVGYKNCLGWPLFKVLLPDFDKADSGRFKKFDLSGVSIDASLLHLINGGRVDPGVAVPICSVDLDGAIGGGNVEIKDGGEFAETISNEILPDIVAAKQIKLVGDFVLKPGRATDDAFCEGACSCYRQLGPGLLGVPIIISLDSSVPRLPSSDLPGGAALVCDDVWGGDNPPSESSSPASVVANPGTECRAMLSLDLRRGTAEILPADGTLKDGDFRYNFCPADVTALSTTGCLPAMLEPSNLRQVFDAANGADSLGCFVHIPSDAVSLVSGIISQKGFMGKHWDGTGIAFSVDLWREVLRVLKPGGHMVSFGGSRTCHRIASAIETAGFEIRDSLFWIHGQGFPKSMNVGRAIDKAAGVEREVIGTAKGAATDNTNSPGSFAPEYSNTAPATEAAKKWDGWGTALKPAVEPIVLARKPLAGTVAGNVQEWGTGALNVDGCRVGTDDNPTAKRRAYGYKKNTEKAADSEARGALCDRSDPVKKSQPNPADDLGRFPPHLLLTHSATCTETECAEGCPVLELGRQSGERKTGDINGGSGRRIEHGRFPQGVAEGFMHTGDTGTAARFFPTFGYHPKPSRAERSAGLDNSELITVEWLSWENEVQQVALRVDTAPSPPRVTVVSGTQNKSALEWSMWLFGSSSTAPSLMDTRSTIGMGSNSTTKSKTLNWLHRWFTKEFTVDVSLGTGSGGSPAGSVENSTPWITITSEVMESPPGVESATAKTPVKIISKGNRSTHPTVKSLDLMRWLCRLITPGGGTVLDPFMGSGSTGCAALMEEFNFIGIEQEPGYLALARDRIRHWAPMWAKDVSE